MSKTRCLSILLCAVLAGTCPAAAQDFPARHLRIIVPTTPGTVLDTLARAMGSEMSKTLGQPVIVENKPSNNLIVGYEYVARQAPADGYTMAAVAPRELELLPLIVKDLRFDPLTELAPVLGLAEGRWILGSPANAPWRTFAELVAYAKANPGKLNYGASSAQVRFPMLVLLQDLGLDIVHIPYAGGAQYFQALLAGEIQAGFVAEGPAVSFGGRFRALAVTGDRRRAPFPDVPTLKELGHPRIMGVTYSLNVRAGTPARIVEKLKSSAAQALDTLEVKTLFARLHLDMMKEPSSVAARRLGEEAALLAEIARKAGIRPQ